MISLEEAATEGSEDGEDSEIPAAYFAVHKDQIPSILQALMNKSKVVDMGIEEQSLEAVIQRIYEGDQIQ